MGVGDWELCDLVKQCLPFGAFISLRRLPAFPRESVPARLQRPQLVSFPSRPSGCYYSLFPFFHQKPTHQDINRILSKRCYFQRRGEHRLKQTCLVRCEHRHKCKRYLMDSVVSDDPNAGQMLVAALAKFIIPLVQGDATAQGEHFHYLFLHPNNSHSGYCRPRIHR